MSSSSIPAPIEEERNMESLAESWEFLERELENFQRICRELEKGLRENSCFNKKIS